MFPSSGYGQQSKYYDDEILFDGTYQITSVTMHSSSRDLGNADPTMLRKGLLLTESTQYPGFYVPLNTADGYLNGAATQFMSNAVVLAREEHIAYTYIMGMKRRRDTVIANRVIPVYFSCSIKANYVLYNNMDVVAITAQQWENCQRITVVPDIIRRYVNNETEVRALLWNVKESMNDTLDIN